MLCCSVALLLTSRILFLKMLHTHALRVADIGQYAQCLAGCIAQDQCEYKASGVLSYHQVCTKQALREQNSHAVLA